MTLQERHIEPEAKARLVWQRPATGDLGLSWSSSTKQQRFSGSDNSTSCSRWVYDSRSTSYAESRAGKSADCAVSDRTFCSKARLPGKWIAANGSDRAICGYMR